ncbi:hypothetical protein XENOCAPTIV_028200 [Xenoophorus captivus]|uniref:Leucine zipper tumor suppressor 1 n=1 Tax=Xenoophorus captivus TaxID=1517983 RepID=A0ABV0RF84_9TELE
MASSSEIGDIHCPMRKASTPNVGHKQDPLGTLSDSGRNSMSSLPTHSTIGSLRASTGLVSQNDGSSALINSLCKGQQLNFPPWVNGNNTSLDCSYRRCLNSSVLASKSNEDAGSPLSADEPQTFSETAGGIRSPITTDQLLIEHLEQRLLERESELQELQVCQNELQRKKTEADFLRDNVAKLEQDIQQVKQDLVTAREQKLQKSLELERPIQELDCPDQVRELENKKYIFNGSLQREVERLKQELKEEKNAQERLVSNFELERQTWNKEKDRVIKYQKQLQINYLQMHKKNQDLERILKELTAELESRTKLGFDLKYSTGLQTYEDVIATEI